MNTVGLFWLGKSSEKRRKSSTQNQDPKKGPNLRRRTWAPTVGAQIFGAVLCPLLVLEVGPMFQAREQARKKKESRSWRPCSATSEACTSSGPCKRGTSLACRSTRMYVNILVNLSMPGVSGNALRHGIQNKSRKLPRWRGTRQVSCSGPCSSARWAHAESNNP